MNDDDHTRCLSAPPFSLDAAGVAWVRETVARLDDDRKLRQLFNPLLMRDDPHAAARLAAGAPGAVTRHIGGDVDRARASTDALVAGSEIPLLLSGDIEGGSIAPACLTPMTNQLGLAATDSPELAEEAVAVLATEAAALGFNWTFTPVIDINAAFRSAIAATRSYGSDPDTILALARINVRTFQRHGIAATAKHWPGEGFDDRDQHLVTTVNPLDEAEWEASFGRLYRALIDDGVMAVMSGHIAWPAYARKHGATGADPYCPATLSSLLNQGLLRGELGFNGVIVSDATGMAGLNGWMARRDYLPLLIENGCDMILFPPDFEADVATLHAALTDGRLSRRRMDEAVIRILGLKAALGLHRATQALAPAEEIKAILGSSRNADVARRVAGASVTLVKDVQPTLPLSPDRHRRVVLVTDRERTGFAGNPPPPILLDSLLTERSFAVRAYDPDQPPTPDDTDLVLYALAQESLLCQSHIYLDWQRLQGDFRGAMRRFWHDLPCVLVSLGHPYYLYDAPQMPCVVNAYSAVAPVQQAVVERLLGKAPFTGTSPVDAFCGLPADYVLAHSGVAGA